MNYLEDGEYPGRNGRCEFIMKGWNRSGGRDFLDFSHFMNFVYEAENRNISTLAQWLACGARTIRRVKDNSLLLVCCLVHWQLKPKVVKVYLVFRMFTDPAVPWGPITCTFGTVEGLDVAKVSPAFNPTWGGWHQLYAFRDDFWLCRNICQW